MARFAVTVVFVALVSIATEFGENFRFRFLVDPLVIGLAVGETVTWIGRRGWRRGARRSGTPQSAPAANVSQRAASPVR